MKPVSDQLENEILDRIVIAELHLIMIEITSGCQVAQPLCQVLQFWGLISQRITIVPHFKDRTVALKSSERQQTAFSCGTPITVIVFWLKKLLLMVHDG